MKDPVDNYRIQHFIFIRISMELVRSHQGETEAGKLIQGSKQLSDRLKSFEDPSTKGK
jgi:hypothetical protein